MWGAHEADGRISAKNAVKIRAALRTSVNAELVYDGYQATQPIATDFPAQDRARARAWVMMNIRLNNEALRLALLRLYAEAWVTGDLVGREEISTAQEDSKKSLDITKADDIAIIDWSKWNPGDAAAAMLLDPPKAFQNLVNNSGSLIRGLDKTGYDLVGTALADSIRLGYSPRRAAKLINETIGNPARALTIAVTESSRVMNASALNRYQEAGLTQVQWATVLSVAGGGSACEKCAANDGQIVELGASFNSGNSQPPAHPHCRCNLRPVVPDYEDISVDEQGVARINPPAVNEAGVADIMVQPLEPMPYKWNPSYRYADGKLPTKDFYEALDTFENVAKAPISISVDKSALKSIVEQGQMKSIGEVRKRAGSDMSITTNYRKARIRIENEVWGVPKEVPQPIYGYLDTNFNGHRPRVSAYGDVKITLKESVAGRTTMTAGDSLDSGLIPIPLTDAIEANLGNRTLSAAVNNPSGGFGGAESIGYFEVQVHGGVSLVDIKSVDVSLSKITKQVYKSLVAQGIEVIGYVG